MIDPSFRDELLKQNRETTMEARLKVLDDLVQADRRSLRRLTIGTIAVWAVWVSMIAATLGMPMILAATIPQSANQPPVSSTTTTTLPQPIPEQGPSHSGGIPRVVAAIFAIFWFAMLVGLPIAGVVLIVMRITARRSATMSQIQGSLAEINTQLSLLLRERKLAVDPQG
jgi:hypothetical protein